MGYLEKLKSNPVLLDFWAFLKKPNDVQLNLSFKEKTNIFLVLLTLELAFTVLLVFPIQYGIEEILDLKHVDLNLKPTVYLSLLLFVFAVPLIEEFMFRHFLRYKWLKIDFISREKWNRVFPYLVYFFAMAFGLVHLTNYRNTSLLFYALTPIIVASQLSGGLILSYLRVRLNFSWGVYYHAVWNLIFIIVLPLIYFLFYKPFSEKTKDYSITIKETPFYDNDISIKKKLKVENGLIKQVHFREESLQHLIDTLYSKNKYIVEDAIIDLKFESKAGFSKEAFLKLVEKEYEVNKE